MEICRGGFKCVFGCRCFVRVKYYLDLGDFFVLDILYFFYILELFFNDFF